MKALFLSRRTFLGLTSSAAVALLAACGASQAAPANAGTAAPAAAAGAAVTPAPSASGLTSIAYGQLSPPSVSEGGILIADQKGWFAEQGIKLDPKPFDTATNMVAPLATNQLQAGGGALSAGLFNAVNRSTGIQLVADKGIASPGHGYVGLVVRKDLIDSGKFRSPADLKGLRIAGVPASTAEVGLAALLKLGGLTIKDVNLVTGMGFADLPPALTNKSIDAATPSEPFLTTILDAGVAALYKRSDEYVPNQENGLLFFGPDFAAKTDLAARFMVAYLKGVRLYNDAFDKKIAAARAEVIDILIKTTTLKDKALYDRVVMPGLNPNGAVNTDDVKAQQQYYLDTTAQQQPADLTKLLNPTFSQAAVKQLGAY